MAKENNGAKKVYDVIKIIVVVLGFVITFLVFYGTFENRITTLETGMQYKVDQKELFEKLDQFKKDIETKIETEIQKLNRRNR
ncbi:MAG: hypothetical protein A2V66_03705 [Ignavibacteria bacterium RBG_13_36_8]|nr:MAG: hypothetical protein A2V66_03705 [Ignavibacteria bacterium RBG_13_36_8]